VDKKAKQDFLAGLPDEWPEDVLPEIQGQVTASRRKVVVLDDDPTGTQTVHGVPVLTEWSVDGLRAELANELPAFYLLTNSRSLPLTKAKAMNAEIGHNLVEAARQAKREFAVVSRSDSTLRGHFPGEVSALTEALKSDFDAWLIIPFFLEGGRYTINDVHYVAEGQWLIPAGETEFARDAAFGYQASNLHPARRTRTRGHALCGSYTEECVCRKRGQLPRYRGLRSRIIDRRGTGPAVPVPHGSVVCASTGWPAWTPPSDTGRFRPAGLRRWVVRRRFARA
jgi:hypothetical protein